MAQSLARLQARFKDPSKKLPPTEPIVEDNAVVFGYLYHSGAHIPEDGISTHEAFENPHTPSGRPGSRAAHLLVERQGRRLSTIDICNGQWVLLAGPGGGSWLEAAGQSKLASAVGLQTFQIGPQKGIFGTSKIAGLLLMARF
jgi:putative polyketide hydroxylase